VFEKGLSQGKIWTFGFSDHLIPLLINIATRGPKWQVRKASHCGSKQQLRSQAVLVLLLLVRATYRCYS